MTDRLGEQLGNYRLMRLLGRGGFAEVYLGEHIYLETTAAIKVLHARLASEDADEFRKEARTIARLVHPHIVRVLEFGVEQGTPYLVVDYAPNGTLRKRYPRGTRLPLQAIVYYVNQVASALQYAHEHRVVHRDIKPENMLIGRRQEILLSDFGIALVTQSTQNNEQKIQDMAGTIAYMAPEQIQSQAQPASDQYALGVVVYEWLSGVRPFQGSFAEVAVKQTLVAPPSLREKMPELPLSVEEVVMKALEKEPQQRFPSIIAFARALEQAAQEAVASSQHVTDPLNLSNSGELRSNAESLVPVGIPTDVEILPTVNFPEELVVEGEVSSALNTPDLDVEQSERTVPYVEMPLLQGLQGLQGLVLSSEEKPVQGVGLAGEELGQEEKERGGSEEKKGSTGVPLIPRRALVVGGIGAALLGVGSFTWLAMTKRLPRMPMGGQPVGVENETLLVYRGHSGVVWAVSWMPKGNMVASAGADSLVQVWESDTGNVQYTYSNHSDSVYSIAWSPDGKRVASASYDQTVQVWDATTGYFPKIYNGHSSWVWVVAWSPDGKYLASAGGDKTVQVWEADSLKQVVTYRGEEGFVYALAWSPDSRYLASAGVDQSVQVWDASTGISVHTDNLYNAIVWALEWSPDGKRLAVGGNNQTIQVWDAFSGGNRQVYEGHNSFIYALAWASNGSQIAAAGDDHKVHLWNAATGQVVAAYSGHRAEVRSLSWSPDNTRLASASFDKSVRIWHVPSM
jgi:eukaryotic-like serine/threonine-protein kinase